MAPAGRPERVTVPVIAAPSPARDRVRLLAVALGAFAVCAAYVWRGYFSSDFWEHAAVVRELSTRPFSPAHPLFALEAPHAYVSPYLLGVGLAARATGAAAIPALAAAGLLNIVLLILALRRFLVRLPGGEAAAPYALLFIVFLWGQDAWMWSGFFHIGMLGYTAPYPSTLAAAALFLCLSLLSDALDRGRRGAFVGIGLLVALCAITHPPTALALLVGLAGLLVGRVKEGVVTNGALLLAAVVTGLAGALAWPYFPVLELLTAQPPEFHSWSGVFYQAVPARVWPAIAGLSVLLWRLRKDRRDPLVLSVAFLGLIYTTGGITENYGLGRAIAFMVVFVQIALGLAAAALESRLPARRAWLVPAGAVVAMLALVAHNRPAVPRLLRYEPPLWRQASPILTPVRPGDVVLADSRSSYVVPALTGGRVVAWRHPVYWVPDHAARRAMQDRFFGDATDWERRATIARYHVRWLFLNRDEVGVGPDNERRLLELGRVAAERGSLMLLDLAHPR